MSDELDEELVYTRAAEAARKVPLAGRLAGAGRMPADQVEHLGALWWDETVKARGDRLPMSSFVAYVYRCARLREREDRQREEIRRNTRLAENMKRDTVPSLDEVIRYAREHGEARLDVPGPRAAQLADEVVRLREQVAEFERLRTLGGPAPAVDTEWANRSLAAPASAHDPGAPPLRTMRCLGCGHMFNRHDPDGGGCVVRVETNHVGGVATGLEPCGCKARRPA